MGEHPTNDPTNALHRLAMDLERGKTPADVADDIDFALTRIAELEAKLATALGASPDLTAVIAWLKNGCDPVHAVTELEIYQARLASIQERT